MEFSIKNASNTQLVNAGKLQVFAGGIGMDLTCYGQIGYNDRYGNTYLWLEDYRFSLFINDSSDTIEACYSCPVDGEEVFIDADNMTLRELEDWAEEQARLSDDKE